ncbi:unnamed protein product [Brachionus calyciflorus]|uniref:Homeobox domain-containing protein n=1 Tax=Brachionus calyciflorus TaxID=104777 RepID=A0A814PUE1_9BILA|nr:unnamed protein product [Brachionus calyciflorus]
MYYPNNQESSLQSNANQFPTGNGNNYSFNQSFDSASYNSFYQENPPYYQNYNYPVYSYFPNFQSNQNFQDSSSPLPNNTVSPKYNYNYYNNSDQVSLNSSGYTNFDIEKSQSYSLSNTEFDFLSGSSPSNPILEKNDLSENFFTNETPKIARNKPLKEAHRSRKQLLPDLAVDIMNDWFEDHINNPYPTLEEKEKMARQAGITVKQVTAWFSNRRNRSQNTKPKRIKRVIEQEINQIYNELAYNPNSTHLLEKFRKTLLSQ